jgi:hypothetical protein
LVALLVGAQYALRLEQALDVGERRIRFAAARAIVAGDVAAEWRASAKDHPSLSPPPLIPGPRRTIWGSADELSESSRVHGCPQGVTDVYSSVQLRRLHRRQWPSQSL